MLQRVRAVRRSTGCHASLCSVHQEIPSSQPHPNGSALSFVVMHVGSPWVMEGWRRKLGGSWEPSWLRSTKNVGFFTIYDPQSMGRNQANTLLKLQPSHLPLLHRIEHQEEEKWQQKGFEGGIVWAFHPCRTSVTTQDMAPVPSSPFCSLPNSAAAPTPSSGWGSFLGGLPLIEHLLGARLSPAWIWGHQVSLWLSGWLWGTHCNTDFGGSVGCTVRNQWGLAVSRWRWALKRCNKQSCASCPASAKATGVLAVLGVPRFRSKDRFWDGMSTRKLLT